MRIETPESSVRLEIAGYQFPNIEDEEYDSNWLVIEGELSCPQGNWTFRDPCLLVWEAGELVRYLESLATGTASPYGTAFTEPNLTFEPVESGGLRITFSAESCPPWYRALARPSNSFAIELVATGAQLQSAAASLRRQLEVFPGRAGRNAFENAA